MGSPDEIPLRNQLETPQATMEPDQTVHAAVQAPLVHHSEIPAEVTLKPAVPTPTGYLAAKVSSVASDKEPEAKKMKSPRNPQRIFVGIGKFGHPAPDSC